MPRLYPGIWIVFTLVLQYSSAQKSALYNLVVVVILVNFQPITRELLTLLEFAIKRL